MCNGKCECIRRHIAVCKGMVGGNVVYDVQWRKWDVEPRKCRIVETDDGVSGAFVKVCVCVSVGWSLVGVKDWKLQRCKNV